MAMKFQYDEQGDSFVYFVLAFLVLVLCPSSYFFWPRVEVDGKVSLKSVFAVDRSRVLSRNPYSSCGFLLIASGSVYFAIDSEKLGSKCACDNCEHKRSKIRSARPSKKLQRALM